jgi:hypothetical protein
MMSTILRIALLAGLLLNAAPNSGYFLKTHYGFLAQTGASQMILTRRGIEVDGCQITFLNANRQMQVEGLEPLGARISVINGRVGNNSRKSLQAYAAVRFVSLYPGIDLIYRAESRGLKSDFIVSPGARPDRIRLRYEGFDSVTIRQGALRLQTSKGEYVEKLPLAYQLRDGKPEKIGAHFVQLGPREIGFALLTYDHSLPLIIDPALSQSTYFGGSRFDAAAAAHVDASGNLYIAGATSSPDLPSGPLNRPLSRGTDAFVAKFNAAGQLLFVTYLGGQAEDRATGLIVDTYGSVWITGWTSSSDFPIQSARQTNFKGSRDAFIAVLSGNGDTLYMSTYYGGLGSDMANAIATDVSRSHIYIVGETDSADFPILNALQPTLRGRRDAFVLKFNASGRMLFASYLGGLQDDLALGVNVDAGGNGVIVGATESGDFPQRNAAQAWLAGGQDAFVCKISASGDQLVFSTFLGGTGGIASQPERAHAVAVDAAGTIYVAGVTSSRNLATPGAFQPVAPSDPINGFIAKFDSAGNRLFFSYLGGSSVDVVTGVAVSNTGVLLTGYTASRDFPIVNPIQAAYGGNYDAFVCNLLSSGAQVSFCSFLGGSGADSALAVVSDSSSAIAVVGMTYSQDFPLINAIQGYNLGEADAFLVRLCDDCSGTPSAVSITTAAGAGSSQIFQAVYADPDGAADISLAELVLSDGSSSLCRIYYSSATGTFGLADQLDTRAAGSIIPGLLMWAETPNCMLNGASSSASASGSQLTVRFALFFKSGFAGVKSLLLRVTDRSGRSSGWVRLGSYNVLMPSSLWPPSGPGGPLEALRVQYADVTGDHRPDIILENPLNQFLVAESPNYDALSVWIQHGATIANQMRYADVNGDGKADALYFDTLRSNGLWVSLSTGRGFAAPSRWVSFPGPSTPDQLRHPDINGDGLADAVYFDAGRSNGIWVCLSTGSGFTEPRLWLQHGASVSAQLQFADVNGDGKADALYFDTFRSRAIWVSLSTGASFTSPSPWLQLGSAAPEQVQYADVNGDGKADALYFDSGNTNQVIVAVSDGTAFINPSPWLQHGPSAPNQISYVDVNGDRRADALYFDVSRSGSVWVSLSTGTTFTSAAPWIWYPPSRVEQLTYRDLNNDGKADAIYFDPQNTQAIWISYSDGTRFSTPSLAMSLR